MKKLSYAIDKRKSYLMGDTLKSRQTITTSNITWNNAFHLWNNMSG